MGRMLCLMTAVQGEPLSANEGTGWTVNDAEFGARLALVRQRMQWNIKEAARECGVPAASWASWEAGGMPRRYTEVCDKISRRTGADYVWLVAGPQVTGPRPQATARYLDPPVRTTDRRSRPRDNRPAGHPSGRTTIGLARTGYLPRGPRPDHG